MQQQQLYCEDSGESDFDYILFYIHGNLGTSHYWDPLVQQLQKQSTKLRHMRVDLRGCGRSQQLSQVDSISQLADDVKQVLDSRVTQLDKVILIGWSLGGLVGMELCATYPQLYQRLVLVCSGPVTGVPIMKHDDVLGQATPERCQSREEVNNNPRIKFMSDIIEQKNYPGLKQIYDQILFNSGYKPIDQIYDQLIYESLEQSNYVDVVWSVHNFDISAGKQDRAKLIVGPVLVVHGQKDLLIDVIYAQGIVKEIGQDKCTIVIHDSLGHMIPLEDPNYLSNQIIQYIKQL